MKSFKLGVLAVVFALFATLGATSVYACEGNPNCDHSKKSMQAADQTCADCKDGKQCEKCAAKSAKNKAEKCDCESKKDEPKEAPAMKCAPGKCG